VAAVREYGNIHSLGRGQYGCGRSICKKGLYDERKYNTIKEIWHSQEYLGVRNALLGGRENMDLCKYCDAVN
jgi:hypothetical protein